jgi:hypothetical protein
MGVEVISMFTALRPAAGGLPAEAISGHAPHLAGWPLASLPMLLPAYRHDVGWMLGHSFLKFVHTGGKTD